MNESPPTQALLDISKANILGWSMVLLFVALNIFGALLLKNEVQKLGDWSFSSLRSSFLFTAKLISSWKIYLALTSLFGSTIAWSVALSKLELSKAYPVGIGLHFLAIMTSSMVLYGESLTLFKVWGIVLILIGVLLLIR